MSDIISRIKQGQLWDFPGGVHPPQRKALSNQSSIEQLPLPAVLHVQIKQHIGVEGQVIVKPGDKVLKGQPLTHSMNPFAVPVHAPTSGSIQRIGPHVSAHPSAIPELTVDIIPDGKEQWMELSPLADYQHRPKVEIVEAICAAGISGLGGAGFPTHIKVSPKKDVEFLIINGVECEPYITSDDRLMREHAWQVRQGIDVLHHLLEPAHVLIAIEDNKPEAIEAMKVACQDQEHYQVVSIPTKYPAGGEKQLIQVLTGREVPKQGLPTDVGVIMQNVGTCFAIADAIFSGKPLLQRVVTLTGQALKAPKNVWALLGTPMSHLLQEGQYQADLQPTKRLIMGGPMMGFNLSSDKIPVVKISNCLLVPTEEEMPSTAEEQACIRCGACADACPAGLLPQQLFWYSKAKELDKAQEYNLFDCIECGACAFVCPSEIPLVHYYRTAKADIRLQEEERQKADKARERFEARNARLERDKQEREEKHRQAAEARRKAMEEKGNDSKSKIEAALARVKAKKTSDTPATDDNKSKVSAAIERAKAKKAAQQSADAPADSAETAESDKKQQVAAAIARAKAKREAARNQADDVSAKAAETAGELTSEENKNQQVAAAIARAKAKREAAKNNQQTDNTQAQAPAETPESAFENASETQKPDNDDKQARIAAAVAKAKARKQETEHAEPTSDKSDDDKKARIAAAVAKAKARKQAQQNNDKGEDGV